MNFIGTELFQQIIDLLGFRHEIQTASITYSISGTEVGSYTGTFGDDFKVMSGETDVTANYTLTTKTPGTLIITKSEIAQYVTLTPVDVVKTYDGTTYTAGVATAVDANGKTVKVEYSVNGTDWTEDQIGRAHV